MLRGVRAKHKRLEDPHHLSHQPENNDRKDDGADVGPQVTDDMLDRPDGDEGRRHAADHIGNQERDKDGQTHRLGLVGGTRRERLASKSQRGRIIWLKRAAIVRCAPNYRLPGLLVVAMRDVRSSGKTGSGQRWGEPTRLTQGGHLRYIDQLVYI